MALERAEAEMIAVGVMTSDVTLAAVDNFKNFILAFCRTIPQNMILPLLRHQNDLTDVFNKNMYKLNFYSNIVQGGNRQ